MNARARGDRERVQSVGEKSRFDMVVYGTASRRSAPLAAGLIVMLALPIVGCAHRTEAMLAVATGQVTTSKVDMLVATTRLPAENPGVLFSGERADDISLSNVVISIPPDGNREVGAIQWPDSYPGDPLKSFVTTKAQTISETRVNDWFKRTSGPRRKALIFVHGFNTTYSEAVFRFAQLAHDLKIEAAPVLFTWPSRGNALDYVYDRESTVYSRFGLVAVLQEAIASRDVENVTIVAHSMGTSLAIEALREVAIRNHGVSPKIRTVVLASPDIDIDVFRRQVVEMGPKRPAFLVFSSRNDLALLLSKWIAGDVDRLGGVDLRENQALLAKLGVTVIDATDVAHADPLGHTAFAESAEMLNALLKLVSLWRN